ncbi:MAG: hypothetical protein DWQ10_03345 [Calditrichaeota bacterium]|nr:MAG: hypothetical protein DWQ10_03345 [Calditrichota bacterium]
MYTGPFNSNVCSINRATFFADSSGVIGAAPVMKCSVSLGFLFCWNWRHSAIVDMCLALG